jgi:hypothetical protein
MAEENDRGALGDLISRFEQGLMLASDKQYILNMLSSSAAAMMGYPEAAIVCAEL